MLLVLMRSCPYSNQDKNWIKNFSGTAHTSGMINYTAKRVLCYNLRKTSTLGAKTLENMVLNGFAWKRKLWAAI